MVFPQGIFHLHCQTTTHNIMINYYSMFNNDTCPRSLIFVSQRFGTQHIQHVQESSHLQASYLQSSLFLIFLHGGGT